MWRGFLTNIAQRFLGKKIIKLLIEKVLKRPFPSSLNEILVNDFNTGLVTLLHNADKGSMAHSVESRMPFLDYRLVEFLASVPSTYKIHKGWSKYLARMAFDNKLPDEICWRKDKQGWPIPEDSWFGNELKDWLKTSLQDFNQDTSIFNSFTDEDFSSKNRVSMLRTLNIQLCLKAFNTQLVD